MWKYKFQKNFIRDQLVFAQIEKDEKQFTAENQTGCECSLLIFI